MSDEIYKININGVRLSNNVDASCEMKGETLYFHTASFKSIGITQKGDRFHYFPCDHGNSNDYEVVSLIGDSMVEAKKI